MYPAWISKGKKLAPEYLHLHTNCTQESRVNYFSRYIMQAVPIILKAKLMGILWNDLNYPARMATLAVAGVPVL